MAQATEVAPSAPEEPTAQPVPSDGIAQDRNTARNDDRKALDLEDTFWLSSLGDDSMTHLF
jgi:hypothetical protein